MKMHDKKRRVFLSLVLSVALVMTYLIAPVGMTSVYAADGDEPEGTGETITITIDMQGHADQNYTIEVKDPEPHTNVLDLCDEKMTEVYGEDGPVVEGYVYEGFATKPESDIHSLDELWESQSEAESMELTEDVTVYAVFRPLAPMTDVAITFDQPVGGSSAADEPLYKHLKFKGDYMVWSFWTTKKPESEEDTPFTGTFKCGETYYANIGFEPEVEYPYVVDYSTADDISVTINGKTVENAPDYHIPVVATHTLKKVPAKAATTTAAGNIEHWTCDKCHKYFKDAEGKTEIKQADTVIPKLPGGKQGWKKENGDWYYYNADGKAATNTWKKDSKGWCYLGKDGKMVANGWAKDSKGTVWMNGSGYWDNGTKWIKDNGEWYHITKGYMDANKWKKDSHGWCYLGKDGKMITNGWAKDSHGWCWIGANGYWTKSKWVKDNGEWYYIKSNHYMASNEWAKDSHGWMFMAKNGKVTKAKWVKWNGAWYYLKDDGYMATDTLKIGSKTYKFAPSGKWVN